ncbi:MAG: aminopeptidase P N-terminal domain-containing protein [Polyangiaceae bacterium]
MENDLRESFAKRRAVFYDAMTAASPSAIAVLPAAPVFPRNNDVDHEYRQDSDFFYLTGFDEPESALLLDGPARKMVLLTRPRDPEREVWDGPRAGVDGAKERFAADEAFPIAELDDKLPAALENRRRIYYRLGRSRSFDDRLLGAVQRVRGRQRTGVFAPTEIVDPSDILHEMRLRKSPDEIATMRAATRITREAHELAMGQTRPGMYEYEIEGQILDTFRRRGSERPAYGSIVASGPNACVLHHRKNDRQIGEGELLLIDAGCEYGYYASDVTRTFPVGRDFSREQQAIYELVLEAQLQGIAATRTGATLDEIHKLSVETITGGLLRLGLLSGEPEKIIETNGYKRFFMHRTSHWLGMDVHDVGNYFVDGQPRKLEPGMVLTVEPGIYISPTDDTVGPEWRGIGVRIEDDVLVRETGPEVLTAGIPKTVEEVRKACSV